MRRVKLFTIDALPYRQPIPVYGYRFGSRKKTLAVMGAIKYSRCTRRPGLCVNFRNWKLRELLRRIVACWLFPVPDSFP